MEDTKKSLNNEVRAEENSVPHKIVIKQKIYARKRTKRARKRTKTPTTFLSR
jgi:hypothetical protein